MQRVISLSYPLHRRPHCPTPRHQLCAQSVPARPAVRAAPAIHHVQADATVGSGVLLCVWMLCCGVCGCCTVVAGVLCGGPMMTAASRRRRVTPPARPPRPAPSFPAARRRRRWRRCCRPCCGASTRPTASTCTARAWFCCRWRSRRCAPTTRWWRSTSARLLRPPCRAAWAGVGRGSAAAAAVSLLVGRRPHTPSHPPPTLPLLRAGTWRSGTIGTFGHGGGPWRRAATRLLSRWARGRSALQACRRVSGAWQEAAPHTGT